MKPNSHQASLFAEEPDPSVIHLNGHCRIVTRDGYRVVSIHGIPVFHFSQDDRLSQAAAIVNLVAQGHALQSEVALGFGCSPRTVRRQMRRFEEGGLSALGRGPGYPRGRPRLPQSRCDEVNELKSNGVSNREIARRLGVTEKAIRKLLKRLGWKSPSARQMELDFADADPNMSAPSKPSLAQLAKPDEPSSCADSKAYPSADPNVSATETRVSFDPDPANRCRDRVFASMGLLNDAAPRFRCGQRISGAGVLLAIPAIMDNGVVEVAEEVYGSIGPAFYGLRTTIVTFLMMALMRIKHPENLKEHSPIELGRLLGLDRAPEVKTLRRKLERLASMKRAMEFGRALARKRVEARGPAMGFLYVDGHVRAYHGKRTLPKTHVARMRISMPATTDYWVNDRDGEPLFVVNTEANRGLVKILPVVLDEVRALLGDRRVTVVFDRGGWSPKLFAKLIQSGFDILTYRKGRWRKVAKKNFSTHQGQFDGRTVKYQLADQNILLLKRSLRLRQVTRLTDTGHQTPIVTSRFNLAAIEVAYRMFERWRQENFFKYQRQEYALDALIDYSTEPADPTREVPNPQRKKIDAQLKKARVELEQVQAVYGHAAFFNIENERPTMRGFKIANADLSSEVVEAFKRVLTLERKRARIPTRIPVQKVTKGEVLKLRTEAKLISDLLKMVAYQAESDLVRSIAPLYSRSEDEGRTLIQSILMATGDINVSHGKLAVEIEPLSSPHRNHVLVALCEQLNDTETKFPGTDLALSYTVKPLPECSPAFPGPRKLASSKPDK